LRRKFQHRKVTLPVDAAILQVCRIFLSLRANAPTGHAGLGISPRVLSDLRQQPEQLIRRQRQNAKRQV
jgi:hypothetical protein